MRSSCYLGLFGPDDLSDLIALDTDPGVREFLGGPVEPANAERRALAHISGTTGEVEWAIRRVGDDAFLGIISLHPHHDGEDTEVSYALLPRHQGHGHATEALRLVLKHAASVLGLDRLVAETQSRNVKSMRLLARVGMKLERTVIRFGEEQSIHGISLPVGKA
ncbi:MAG: GNAT family N-acetyltransferase [Luteolibacter sp.]